MKLQSIPHTIDAFRFEGTDTKPPKWFIEAVTDNQASVTFYGDDKYISIYRDDHSYARAFVGEWICLNEQGTIFKLTNDEIRAGFIFEDDL